MTLFFAHLFVSAGRYVDVLAVGIFIGELLCALAMAIVVSWIVEKIVKELTYRFENKGRSPPLLSILLPFNGLVLLVIMTTPSLELDSVELADLWVDALGFMMVNLILALLPAILFVELRALFSRWRTPPVAL